MDRHYKKIFNKEFGLFLEQIKRIPRYESGLLIESVSLQNEIWDDLIHKKVLTKGLSGCIWTKDRNDPSVVKFIPLGRRQYDFYEEIYNAFVCYDYLKQTVCAKKLVHDPLLHHLVYHLRTRIIFPKRTEDNKIIIGFKTGNIDEVMQPYYDYCKRLRSGNIHWPFDQSKKSMYGGGALVYPKVEAYTHDITNFYISNIGNDRYSLELMMALCDLYHYVIALNRVGLHHNDLHPGNYSLQSQMYSVDLNGKRYELTVFKLYIIDIGRMNFRPNPKKKETDIGMIESLSTFIYKRGNWFNSEYDDYLSELLLLYLDSMTYPDTDTIINTMRKLLFTIVHDTFGNVKGLRKLFYKKIYPEYYSVDPKYHSRTGIQEGMEAVLSMDREVTSGGGGASAAAGGGASHTETPPKKRRSPFVRQQGRRSLLNGSKRRSR